MTDDLKFRLAVIGLLCLLPVASALAAVVHVTRRSRRTRDDRARGFGVITRSKS